MPFLKIKHGKGSGKYRSPSGRIFNKKQVARYYARGGTFDTPLICDAVTKTGDPTGTLDIRRAYIREMDKRWRKIKVLLQQGIVTQDLLGLKIGNVGALAVAASMKSTSAPVESTITFGQLPDANKVRALQAWVGDLLGRIVVQGDGAWLRPMLSTSYNRAIARAMRLSKSTIVPFDQAETIDALFALTVAELQGISEALVQRVTREASLGILHHDKPIEVFRRIAQAIQTIGNTRSSAMIELMVVKTHATATLDQFEAAGLTHVGLVPEVIQTKRIGDAIPRGTGPGSRISRLFAPSLRTVQRIRAAQRVVELSANVNVETAGDFDVCPICEDIEDGNPYTINEARALIPAHPRCRCAFIPADEFDDAIFKDQFASLCLKHDYNPFHDPLGRFASGPSSHQPGPVPMSPEMALEFSKLQREAIERVHKRLRERQLGQAFKGDANPYHKGAGTPEGGQFTSGPEGVVGGGGPKSKIPKFLYHVAHVENVASIKKVGLKGVPDHILAPDVREGVNLVNSPDDLYRPDKPTDRHVRISTRGLDKSKFVEMGEGWWRYLGHIPKKHIVGIGGLKEE